MKLTVDQDKCCGAGACVLSAPEVFDQRDEDGIVTLLTPNPAPSTTLPYAKRRPCVPPRRSV